MQSVEFRLQKYVSVLFCLITLLAQGQTPTPTATPTPNPFYINLYDNTEGLRGWSKGSDGWPESYYDEAQDALSVADGWTFKAGTVRLDGSGDPSGATIVGVDDSGLTYITADDVQEALEDLDTALSGLPSGTGDDDTLALWNGTSTIEGSIVSQYLDRIGVNISTPASALSVWADSADYNLPGGTGIIAGTDTQAFAQGVGGSFVARGKYNSSGNTGGFAGWSGTKANSTDGNSEGIMSLKTNDGSSLVDALVLDEDQNATFTDEVYADDYLIERTPGGGVLSDISNYGRLYTLSTGELYYTEPTESGGEDYEITDLIGGRESGVDTYIPGWDGNSALTQGEMKYDASAKVIVTDQLWNIKVNSDTEHMVLNNYLSNSAERYSDIVFEFQDTLGARIRAIRPISGSVNDAYLAFNTGGDTATNAVVIESDNDVTMDGDLAVSGIITTGGAGIIAGSGTVDNVAVFTGGSSVGDSTAFSQSGSDGVVAGNLTIEGSNIDNSGSGTDLVIDADAGNTVQIGDIGGNSDVYVPGSLGVGTASPSQKLEVAGNIEMSGGNVQLVTPDGYFYLNNNAEIYMDFDNFVNFRNAGNSKKSIFYIGELSDDGVLYLYNSTGNIKVKISANGDTYFNGGDVGIGTSSPVSPLHVEKTATGWVAHIANENTASGANSGLFIDAGQDSGDSILLLRNQLGTSYFKFRADGSAILENGADLLLDGDASRIKLGASQDYNILFNGADAAHTISSGSFKFSGGDLTIDSEFNNSGAGDDLVIDADSGNIVQIGDIGGNSDVYVPGSLGVGTASPGNLLELYGSAPYTRFSDSDGGDVYSIGNFNGAFQIYNINDDKKPFFIDGDSDVGIGTTSPDSLLQLKSSAENSEASGFQLMDFDDTNILVSIFENSNTDEGAMRFKLAGTNKIQIRANGDSYFNGGDVGIGDSTPSYELDVAGDIAAQDDLFVQGGYAEVTQTGGSAIYSVKRSDLAAGSFNAYFRAQSETGTTTYLAGHVGNGGGYVYLYDNNGILRCIFNPAQFALRDSSSSAMVTFSTTTGNGILAGDLTIEGSDIDNSGAGADLVIDADAGNSIQMGDIGGNSDTEFNGDVVYNDTFWEDLRFPSVSIKIGATKAPGFAQFKDDGSGSTGVYTYYYDDSSEEQQFLIAQLPHAYKEGTDIEPHVHWAPSDANSGNVVWGLEYTWQNIDGTFGNTTAITVTDAADGTADKHQIADFATITGTSKTLSSILVCRIYRDATNASDTYASDAALLEVDIHYEIDAPGSDSEYTK